MQQSTRRLVGIIFIYTAAVLIMFSILFLFKVIHFPYAYTTAAFGFLVYIVGMFFSREGKLSAYKVAMIIVAAVLIAVAVFREIA